MAVTRRALMTGADRRAQILDIAAGEFARSGLHGTSAETIARRAGTTRAYVFRLFGTQKHLFIDVARTEFDQLTEGMVRAAGTRTGLDALAALGPDPVPVKTFLAFGMLRNASAAMEPAGLGDGWAAGAWTRIQAGLFRHITTENNQ